MKLGFIFKEKYGIDASTLTLKEIDEIIFKGRTPRIVGGSRSIWSISDHSLMDELDEWLDDNIIDKI